MESVKPKASRNQSLLQAVRQRLEEQKKSQPRRGDGHVAPSLQRGPLLVYTNGEDEERFIRFIHTSPLMAALFVNLAIFAGVIRNITQDQSARTVIQLTFTLSLLFVEIFIQFAARRREGDALHRLLLVERGIVVFILPIVSVSGIMQSYSIHNDCSRMDWEPIGSQPKAYREGYCQFWSIFYGVLVVLQVIRFQLIMAISAFTLLVTGTLWMFPGFQPQRDTAGVVIRGNLLTLAGCAFMCFIRYIDETQQRRHFEAQERLLHSAEVLSSKRVATLERFLAVLPLAISKRLREGRWKASQVDTSADATVLVTRVHDFVAWSTSVLPLEVAALVAAMQAVVDGVLRKRHLERVGRMGDTTVAVGNLLERLDGNMPAATIDVGRKLALLGRGSTSSRALPLIVSVHMGAVEGVLHGTRYVRYEAKGPAVDATRKAVALCEQRNMLVGSLAIMGAAVPSDDHFVDGEPSLVDIGSGVPVPFRFIDFQRATESQGSSATQESLPAAVVDDIGGDTKFVTGVSKLLGQRGLSTGSQPNTSISMNDSVANDLETSATAETGTTALLDIETDRFGFYQFSNTETETRFLEKRMKQLPQRTAKIWLGYAAFVSLVLVTLLTELEGPYAVVGAILLVIAVMGSVFLAVVPRLLSEHPGPLGFTTLSVFVPLLTVFGCALSRPSMVGLDVRSYVAVGAFMRSFSLNDARLQAVAVPLFSLVSLLHYLVPGAHDAIVSIPMIWIFLITTVVAGRNREGNNRRSYRRGMMAEAVLHDIEEVSRVQTGLLRSSMPRCVFDAAAAAEFRGPREVHQAPAVVMVIHAATMPNGKQQLETATLGRVLDCVLATKHLSTAGVLGDDAMVVGPVPATQHQASQLLSSNEVIEQALGEALSLGLKITQADDISGQPQSAPAQSVLLDQDTVAHIVELASPPNYSLLGASATRLFTIGSDVLGMVRGLHVTDRVTSIARESLSSLSVVVEPQAPVAVRGQGVLRFNKIQMPSVSEVTHH